jgi:hypothetical protein
MVYHVCQNPEYVHFFGMNYPYGESLILTDGQAAFSILLKSIHEHIMPICDFIPGIVHAFILVLIPLTSVFLFLIFEKLKVKRIIALLFAILITFLSPQLMRVTGHFGLAYPFFIPMMIYWFLDKYENINFRFRDLLFGTVVFFFFINNPYVGFAGAGLFLVSAFLVFCVERNKKSILLLLTALIPLFLGYIAVELSDPFQDRIERQWGFFFLYASIAGMFFPKGSFLFEIFHPEQIFGDVRFEGQINVGMVVTITIFTVIISYFVFKLRKKQWPINIPKSFMYIFWGSFLMFLYAANYSLYGFAREFMEAHMGPLLMFKASGRLAWTFYYGLTIMASFIIFWWAENNFQNNLKQIGFFVLIGLVWASEDLHFLNRRYGPDIYYDNVYKSQELKDQLHTAGISKENYAAMYLLPVIQTWNDKFLFELDFHTQRASQTMSALTGIPMINGMMSRAPLESSITAIQLAAHPLLHRARLSDMNGGKPFLLIHGNQKQKLTIGEKHLLSKGKFVTEFLESKIYQVDLIDFKENSPPTIQSKDAPFYHSSWKKNNVTPVKLTEPGALHLKKGRNTIFQDSLPALLQKTDDNLLVSIWYYNDHRFFEVPKLEVKAGGKQYSFFNRSSYDYLGYWVRQEIEIPSTDFIEITSDYKHEVFYDDLHIQKANDTTLVYNEGILIWNNYPIKENEFILLE